MNLEDDNQSKASVYTSYTAATDTSEGLIRMERGRAFNVLSETYSLPTDTDEWNRLDKQHMAITLGLGGLYPAPDVVHAVLAPQVGVTKRIVDLGCGTGVWAIEMAREFPHCEVVGIDLARVPLPEADLPTNCRFEVDDINLGLPHLKEQFDVVFCRAVALGLKDFRKSLEDVCACAKPGGIIIWIDADYSFYSKWPMTYRPFFSSSNPDGSCLQRCLYEVRRVSESLLGSDLKTMEAIMEDGFWNHAIMLDPATCKVASLYLPVGTWCDAGDSLVQRELVRYVGMLMRQQMSEIPRTTQPLLLKAGWSKELTDRWGAGILEECKKDDLGFRFRVVWGRRREGPEMSAPALPSVVSSSGDEFLRPKYPLYEEYDSEEQARAAATIRNRGKDIPAPPLVSEATETYF